MKESWPEWDASIHEEQPQIERQGRALSYPMGCKIFYDQRTARFSSTSDLPFYETTLSSCTCYDFQERKLPCKHIYRLAHELGVIEIVKRGPGGYNKEVLDSIRGREDVDSDPEQMKRQDRAKEKKCAPLSVDYDNRSAFFKGSGKEPYLTTENSCTCRDFTVRRLPCKHIYRLRTELNENGHGK